MHTFRRRLLAMLATIVLILAGCSGDDDQATGEAEVIDLRESVEEAAEPESNGEVEGADGVAGGTGEAQPNTSNEPVTIVDEPAQRFEQNPTIEASNWIARTFMDSTSVELVWSPVEDADNYRLFRLPTGTADYDAITTGLIEGADEIYEGLDFGYIDTDPPTGQFLTYLIVAEVGDETTEPRWAEALTVDDITPPTPITGLAATDTADGVLLEWEPSFDDVEFAAYNVSILTETGQLQFIGGGADIGQVSFLDDEDFAGTRTYVVAAVDFHNNVSETAQIDVTR